MKIKVQGHEITDAEIEEISLVKRGAIRQPFTIVKFEDKSFDELVRPYQVDTLVQAPTGSFPYEESTANPQDPSDGAPPPRIHPDRSGLAATGNRVSREDLDFLYKASAWEMRNRSNPFR